MGPRPISGPKQEANDMPAFGCNNLRQIWKCYQEENTRSRSITCLQLNSPMTRDNCRSRKKRIRPLDFKASTGKSHHVAEQPSQSSGK